MVGQCHRSNQHESDTTPGGSGRQEGLACSGPWGHEESDTTKRLNNSKDSQNEGTFMQQKESKKNQWISNGMQCNGEIKL